MTVFLPILLLAPLQAFDIAMPVDFEKNSQLSVAGQEVYEHIDSGERNLVAITPHVRPRSLALLERAGYRDWCRIESPQVRRVLFHRREESLTWFVIGVQRTAHIVLATGSRHREHFISEINRHCAT
ncbi:MAG: hypothetical protein R3270_01405 [Gammaproteobacteria bacterium]|nr:hypothetical protein [Gammaproteobacteria bacterium]